MTVLNRSEYFRFRTGMSGLSDDELLLLDRFFDGEEYPLYTLYDEVFAIHANLPFSHRFLDDHVRLLVARWQEYGWLTRSRDYFDEEVGPCYTLTPEGGEIWEQEWNPPWNFYCVNASRGPVRFGRRAWHAEKITSASRKTTEAFFRTGIRCGFFEGTVSITGRSRRTRRLRHPIFVPWKAFPQVCELRFFARRTGYRPKDWDTYEKEKTWWLSPYDLAQLRLNGIV